MMAAGTNIDFTSYFDSIERSIDAHPELSRDIKGGRSTASFDIDRFGVTAKIRVMRKGLRKSREITAFGYSPQDATLNFIAGLDHWAKALEP